MAYETVRLSLVKLVSEAIIFDVCEQDGDTVDKAEDVGTWLMSHKKLGYSSLVCVHSIFTSVTAVHWKMQTYLPHKLYQCWVFAVLYLSIVPVHLKTQRHQEATSVPPSLLFHNPITFFSSLLWG